MRKQFQKKKKKSAEILVGNSANDMFYCYRLWNITEPCVIKQA